MPVIASASAGPRKRGRSVIDHDAQEAGQRLRDRVVARPFDVRAVRAEAADRAVHEPRIERRAAARARAELLGRARPEVLDVDVRVADQPLEQLAIAGLLEVADDAALVAVVGLEMRRIEAALVGAIRIAAGTFDLDHVGAEIGEHHAGAGTGDERALLDDPHAAQHRHFIAQPSPGTKPSGRRPS